MQHGSARYVGDVFSRVFPGLHVKVVTKPDLLFLSGPPAVVADAEQVAFDWNARLAPTHPQRRRRGWDFPTRVVIPLHGLHADQVVARLKRIFPAMRVDQVAGQNMVMLAGYREDVVMGWILVHRRETLATSRSHQDVVGQ